MKKTTKEFWKWFIPIVIWPFMKSWDPHWKFELASGCSEIYCYSRCVKIRNKIVFVGKELVDRANAVENFLKYVITGDETWVYSFGVETKAIVFTMSLKNITHTQKSTARLVQCRSDFDCVLWLWGINSSWMSTLWPGREQGILSEGVEKTERGSEDKQNWFVEVEKNGCCIMTTLRHVPPLRFMIFSQNVRQHSSRSLRSRQTLHQQTPFSSSSWNLYWRDDSLSLLRR